MTSVMTIRAICDYDRAGRRSTLDAMTTTPVVSCQDLRYLAGRYEILKGLGLAVRPGTIFALLGTNGAGKTTTMELLLGQRRPGAGTVRVLGCDPYRERRMLATDLGVVLQEGGCAPDLTVAETVRLWARLHGRRDAGDLLEELDLNCRASARVRHLSGGERRRLDLAVALCGDPKLLLLDEPTSGLDPESRARTWAVLRDRRRAGMTVLLTTHYLEEAEVLADEMAIMHDGRVAAAGTLDEVRRLGTLADTFHHIAAGTNAGAEGGAGTARALGATARQDLR
jgi:ABC-2 type transport system ATP-binding protein